MYHAGTSTPTQAYRQPYSQSPSTPISAHHQHYYSNPHHPPFGAMDPNAYTDMSPPTHSGATSSSFPPSAGSSLPALQARQHLSSQPFDHMNVGAGPSFPQASDFQVIVYECSPLDGGAGTVLTIKCEVNFPPSPPNTSSDSSSPGQSPPSMSGGRALRMVMGSFPIPTAVQVLPEQRNYSAGSQFCQLSAAVPAWNTPGISHAGRGSRVPVYIQVLSETQTVLNSVIVGEFTYGAAARPGVAYSPYSPSSVNSLKRGMDAIDPGNLASGHVAGRRIMGNGYKNEPDISQHAILASGYHGPAMQGDAFAAYPGSYGNSNSGGMVSAPSSYSATGPQPNLQRATQIPATVPQPSSYGMGSNTKASLELQGDLSNMAKGWTTEEWAARRRLVQFWRKQEGTQITAAFAPIAQHDYSGHQQSIIISCIFREDNNCCYVTSVDGIYLLEALVGNRFTVEEKNRIRRNLEGFRPITVSKTKQGSEDFFKLIMGFPNPKPRNIEKDVKVFPWDILGQALRKIIGKYSATYATLSTTPTPPQPGFAPLPVPPYNMAEGTSMSLQQGSEYGLPESTPRLAHHSSPGSSNYTQSTNIYPQSQQQQSETPALAQTNTQSSHSVSPASAQKLGGEYVTLSPSHVSQYAAAPNAGTYWTGGDAALTPSASGGGYGSVGNIPFADQPHQLPHVHQTLSREPRSNDLKILYSSLAQ